MRLARISGLSFDVAPHPNPLRGSVIADAPGNVSAAALSHVASASSAIKTKMTVLLTPEEIDRATRKR